MSKVITEKVPNVAKVFGDSLATVRTEMIKNVHNHAVDLEVNFQSVAISKKGLLVFSKKTESTISIKLATRITPP
jgi:hypothetical protein